MLESCRTVHDVVHVYRRRFALPACVISGHPAFLTTEQLGAVMMPAGYRWVSPPVTGEREVPTQVQILREAFVRSGAAGGVRNG